MTQSEMVLNHLRYKGAITPMDALTQYGIMRLGARIYDLKHQGINISRTLEYGTNRNGDPTHWARYAIMEGDGV